MYAKNLKAIESIYNSIPEDVWENAEAFSEAGLDRDIAMAEDRLKKNRGYESRKIEKAFCLLRNFDEQAAAYESVSF